MAWSDYNIILVDGILPGRYLDVLESIRLALYERALFDFNNIPANISTPLVSGEYLNEQWFTDYQSTMTTLIGRYVDDTDEANWQESAYGGSLVPVASYWTENSILTAIGDASRIIPNSFLSAEWVDQQVRLINKLKWIQYHTGGLDGAVAYMDPYSSLKTDEAWAYQSLYFGTNFQIYSDDSGTWFSGCVRILKFPHTPSVSFSEDRYGAMHVIRYASHFPFSFFTSTLNSAPAATWDLVRSEAFDAETTTCLSTTLDTALHEEGPFTDPYGNAIAFHTCLIVKPNFTFSEAG